MLFCHQGLGQRIVAERLGVSVACVNQYLRRVLCEIAHLTARTKDMQFGLLKKELTVRRGGRRAVVAVAHKILRIAFAMLRDRKSYQDRLWTTTSCWRNATRRGGCALSGSPGCCRWPGRVRARAETAEVCLGPVGFQRKEVSAYRPSRARTIRLETIRSKSSLAHRFGSALLIGHLPLPTGRPAPTSILGGTRGRATVLVGAQERVSRLATEWYVPPPPSVAKGASRTWSRSWPRRVTG